MNILEEIVENVKRKVEKKKKSNPVSRETDPYDGKSLKDSINGFSEISVIGELKRSSPTAGEIRSEFQIKELASSLSSGGVRGISILTEPEYFDGSLEYLKDVKSSVEVPVLRKEFIVDEYQLYRSAEAGADAVLLIAEVLGEDIGEYVDLAHRLGMETLVEASTEGQARLAESVGTDLLGVNNRNLETMEIDLGRTKRIIECTSDKSVIVSESGIKDRKDVERVVKWGADAVLVGTAIMESEDVEEKVRELVYGDVNDKD